MTDQDNSAMDAAPDANLRDARLAQALQHMPDAHMQPSAEARKAVLQHAQAAVDGQSTSAPPAAHRWWQRLLGAPGGKRTSNAAWSSAWGGALASVLVASFITLMWYDQPVPDANPDGPATPAQEVAAAPPAKEIASAEPAAAKPVPRPVSKQPPTPPVAEKKREAIQAPKALAKSEAAGSALALPSPSGAVASPPAVVPAVGSAQRNRADSLSPTSLTITQDGKTTRLSASQNAALLAALRALPYDDQNRACIDAVLETSIAKKRGMDGLAQRIEAAWLETAEGALARNQVTFATLPISLLLKRDGYLAKLRAKGYVVEEP